MNIATILYCSYMNHIIWYIECSILESWIGMLNKYFLLIFPPYIKSWKWSKYNKDVNFRAMVSIIKNLARNFTANGCQTVFLWIWIDFNGNRIQARRIYKSIYTASDLLNNNFNLCHCHWLIFKVAVIFLDAMNIIIL